MKFTSYFSKRVFPRVSSLLVGLYLCMSMSGCQWGDEIVSLDPQNPDNFLVLYSDTSLVQLSTVAMDSVMTGAADRMLVGRYKDPYFGEMNAAAFFQPTFVSALSLPDLAIYDSLVFKTPYDKYYYGDTTKVSNFSVYALTEDITLKSSYSNFTTTPYDPTVLGKKSFAPTPTSYTSAVRFKLSDVLGKKIFDASKANLLTSNEQLLDILKGLVIKTSDTDNSSVVGFSSFGDSTVVEVHYHTEEQDGVTRGVGTFKVTAEYNHIVGDRSATNLALLPLLNSRNSLPSAQSGNQAYIQGGTGIMMRADFPTVRNLKYVNNSVPNRAFLRVTPLQRSMDYPFAPPATLYVFLVDKYNQFYKSSGLPIALTDLAGKSVSGTYVNDLINNKQYYLFDVSGQFTTILASESEETNGLMFVTSTLAGQSSFPEYNTEFSKSTTRLVVGDQNHSTEPGVKLELYYTSLTSN